MHCTQDCMGIIVGVQHIDGQILLANDNERIDKYNNGYIALCGW